ncbi:hypothetical protein C8R46DRAFT_1159146 [Mycena filopes]|nr:hypothetical protein C8R46DRAFT_1159146 [Mycena filopes]
MVMRNGPRRSSFMWGSSTHNTRIERLWVEVGTQFVRRWRGFFWRLERLHQLDVNRPEHLWLLHVMFLDSINADCDEFQTNWNNHPMAGHETYEKSPNASLGRYRDDCEGLHPDTIAQYYGVYGKRRAAGEAGAGNPPDEEVPAALEDQIALDQNPQIRHDAIEVPDHRNPFSDDTGSESLFFELLAEVVEEEVIPTGYGVLPEEWGEDGYPDVEILTAGKRGKTKIRVSLANPIWRQRAELWVQALNVLSHFNNLGEE